MSMEYIRKRYGVPAKRGRRVRHDGWREGTIVAAKGAYLKVRMDGENRSRIYHPTWAMEYLPK